MITIPCVNGSPQRELTGIEKGTVTSTFCDGVDYIFYQGDEPEADPVVIVMPPDWHGLEQTLRYAENESLFLKAYSQSTEKGFNLFTTTLVNGKLGHASENALATAFALIGVTWNDGEKVIINQILADHNFNTRI